MTVTVIATSVFLLLQAGTGLIDGIALNSITNKPISGAQVTATRMATPPPQAAGAQVPTAIVGGVAGGVIPVPEGGRVTVVRPNGFPVQPVQIPPARTDGNGRFSFPKIWNQVRIFCARLPKVMHSRSTTYGRVQRAACRRRLPHPRVRP